MYWLHCTLYSVYCTACQCIVCVSDGYHHTIVNISITISIYKYILQYIVDGDVYLALCWLSPNIDDEPKRKKKLYRKVRYFLCHSFVRSSAICRINNLEIAQNKFIFASLWSIEFNTHTHTQPSAKKNVDQTDKDSAL